MRGFLRISLIAIALTVSGVFGAPSVQAQGTVSPYASYPSCTVGPNPITCTYPNGQQASCESRMIGLGTTRIVCTNPDRSVTTCTESVNLDEDRVGSNESNVRRSCTVANPTGTSGGGTDTTNDYDGVRATTTDSTGSTTVTNNEREWGGGGSCNMLNLDVCFRMLPGWILTAIGFVFLTISGLILFLAGTLFNWVVLRTVFQFGQYFGTSDGMLVAWGVMRDIANIGLLFGFILMGVLLILNVDGGGHGHGHGGGMSAKKAIPRLIIFAVLLNFSLFATQFVVDVANAFGSTFTTLAGDERCAEGVTGGTGPSESLEDCAVKTGISSKILHATGLTNIFGDGRGDLGAILTNLSNRPYAYATSLIMLSIFVLVTAMVLLAGAIMLVIRVVVLSFLMVTSPIGFAGMVIPGLSGIAHKWWDTLIHQAFFAPVYLLLIFISIKLTEGLMGNGTNLTNAILGQQGPGTAGNVQVVMVYSIVIGFMIAALMAAQKFGAMGATFATSFAQRATTYPFSALGRSTVGRVSSNALKSYEAASGRAQRRIENMNIKNPALKWIAKGAATGMLNASNDAVGGTLSAGKNMKFFGGRSFAEEQKHREEQGAHNKHAADQAQQKLDLKNAIASADADAIQTVLQKMGDSDVRDYIKDSSKDLDIIAKNLSPEKFANLMKDKDLSADKKHSLSHARYGEIEGLMGEINTAVKGGATKNDAFKAAKDKLKLWSSDDLIEFAKAEPAAFGELLELDNDDGESIFTDDQREALEKAKGLTNRQRQFVKDQSPAKRVDRYVAEKNFQKATKLMNKIKKAKDRVKLDSKTLATEEIIETLTPADLQELATESKLSDTEREKILDFITSPATAGRPGMKALRDYLDNPRTNFVVKSYWS